MEVSTFDRLTRMACGGSRRDFVRVAIAAATALRMPLMRVAQAQSSGIVAPGGTCSTTAECAQNEMQGDTICSDNGFTADGELHCCANDGCCQTDADCCGDLRCAAGYEICPGFCTRPP